MDAINYTDARKTLATTMDKVCMDHVPTIITRRGADPVVMLSLEDYNAMQETAYLLQSPANAKHLLESIAQAEQGDFTSMPLTTFDD